jgi:hypothetical protein
VRYGLVNLVRVTTRKLDALRVLAEVGIDMVAYRTLACRLPLSAAPAWR